MGGFIKPRRPSDTRRWWGENHDRVVSENTTNQNHRFFIETIKITRIPDVEYMYSACVLVCEFLLCSIKRITTQNSFRRVKTVLLENAWSQTRKTSKSNIPPNSKSEQVSEQASPRGATLPMGPTLGDDVIMTPLSNQIYIYSTVTKPSAAMTLFQRCTRCVCPLGNEKSMKSNKNDSDHI